MIGAILYPRITLCQLCLIMTLVAIEKGEGVLGACPFEVLHQFQLGLLKYILTSLFHYRSVPCHFQVWLDKRSSPDLPSIELIPGSISTSCPPSNEYDSPDGGHTKGGRKRKCASQATDIDSKSKLQRFSDWLKTCPSARDNKTASRDVFSRVSFEKSARIVNGFLERQSDRSIPSLPYQAGLTAVTKMQGQDFQGSCLLTINTFHGRNDGTTICGAGERFHISVMAWHFHNDNLSQMQGVH
jgi:hypothetical protein